MFVDVGEEGVRGPPSHLFDGVTIVPVKFECHCTTGPEGVAADSTGVEALLGKAQVQHSIFDSFADVRDVDVVFGASAGKVGGYRCGLMGGVAHNQNGR